MTNFSDYARFSQQPKNPFEPDYSGAASFRHQGPRGPGPEMSPALQLMFEREQMAEDRALIERLQQMPEEDVNRLAEAEGLSIELGLDAETVKANIGKARRLLAVRQMEDADMADNFPILYRQMQDPDFAALALDDFDKLSTLEKMAAGWESANIMEELSEAANKLRAQGGLFRTEGEKAKYLELTKRMESMGHVDGFFGLTAQTVSQMAIWETGVAIAASGIAAFVPPAAPVLVPIAIGLAGAAPAAFHNYELEGGLAYHQYKQAGIAEDVARRNSHTVGLINAAIEMGTLAFFAKPFGMAGRNLADRSGLTRRLFGSALDTPTASRAWTKTIGRSIASLTSEVAQEVSQENVTALGEYFGKKVTEARDQLNEVLSGAEINMPGGGRVVKEDGKVRVTPDVFKRVTGRPVEFLDADGMITLDGDVGKRFLEDIREIAPIEVALRDETFWSDVWQLSVDTAGQAFVGVGLISQFGPALQHLSEKKKIRDAQAQAQVREEVRTGVRDSTFQQRAPSRMVQLMRKMWRGTQLQEVHVPREEFTRALDDTDLTVEMLEEVFPGLEAQLAQPEEKQPTIVLDGAVFFSSEIAETEFQNRLFKHVKPTAESYTLTEMEAAEAALTDEQKRLRKGLKKAGALRDQVDKDTDDLIESITASTMRAGHRSAQTARDAAKLLVTALRARAEHASVVQNTLVLPSKLMELMGVDPKTFIVGEAADFDPAKVFDQFAGKNAKTADMPAFQQAKDMAKAGATSDEIREATGWFVGPDHQPRFEISDADSVVQEDKIPKTNEGSVLLEEVFSHEELFAAYPEAGKLKFRTVDKAEAARVFPDQEVGGWYSAANNEIVHVVYGTETNPKHLRRTFLHEVQHAIQKIEKFARGTGASRYQFLDRGEAGLPSRARLYFNSQVEGLFADLDIYETLLSTDADLMMEYARARVELEVEKRQKETNLGNHIGYSDKVIARQRSLANEKIKMATERVNVSLDAIIAREKAIDTKTDVSAADSAFGKAVRETNLLLDRLFAEDSRDLYMRTAGEAEARMTEQRADLSPIQRLETPYDMGLAALETSELDGPRDRANLIMVVGETNREQADFRFEPAPASSTTFQQGGKKTSSREMKPGQRVTRGNKLGFWPKLRVRLYGRVKLPKKPTIGQKTTNKNATAQLAAVDALLAAHPDAHTSQEAWSLMQAEAFASAEVPVPPYAFIRDLAGSRMAQKLGKLSKGQIEDATHGFENAALFRKLYTEGKIDVATTGKLFLWSFLSRGVSPYTQESLFIDAFKGAEEWIAKAAAGTFTKKDVKAYLRWSKKVAPKGSGMPGASSGHNLNAFGKSFLFKLAQKDKNGVTGLQKLHDMMSDPQQTGQQIRREFALMGEGVGIDNKVVSFTLLVAGFNDVMVLDRVQVRQLWDDGRFNGYNLYDGVKTKRVVSGKEKQVVLTGSALTDLTMGARGILIYEAIERALTPKVKEVYAKLGRSQDASVGRYHWESWVADSEQEASHGTLGAILEDVKGADHAIARVVAKQGEYATYEYGAGYFVSADGVSGFVYVGPSGKQYTFDVAAFRGFLAEIKKPKNGVVPQGTKTKDPKSGKTKTKNWSITQKTEGLGGPWWSHPDINQEQLDKLAAEWSGADGRRNVDAAAGPASAEDAVGPRPVGPDRGGAPVRGEKAALFDAKRRQQERDRQRSSTVFAQQGATFDESAYRPEVVAWAKEQFADLVAPNGRPTYQNFVEWFGDSKVVDAEGKPMVVFHGSTRAFDTFARSSRQIYGEGFYFGSRPETADNYTRGGFAINGEFSVERGGQVYPAFLSLRNPFIFNYENLQTLPKSFLDEFGNFKETERGIGKRLQEELKKRGHDGVIQGSLPSAGPMQSILDDVTYVAFDSNQIKSTNNEGNFSADEDGMLRQQNDEEGPRGGFNPEKMQVILRQKHDASTLVHEFAHFLFELDTRMAAMGQASPEQLRDMSILVDEFGGDQFSSLEDYITAPAEARRQMHEAVAYNFEIYMYEGKAPSEELSGVFGRLSKAILRVYRKVRESVTRNYEDEFARRKPAPPEQFDGDGNLVITVEEVETLPELNDDVRQVFDRWLAAEEEIELRIREEAIGRLLRVTDTDDLDELDKILLQELVFDHEREAKEKLRAVLMTELKKLRTLRGRAARKLQRSSRAERKKREAEERNRIARTDRIGRILNFLSSGELLNANGTVSQASLQMRLDGAMERLRIAMEERDERIKELTDRQPELDATVANTTTELARLRADLAAEKKMLATLRKAATPNQGLIDQTIAFLADTEAQIQGLASTGTAAKDELKALRSEVKQAETAIEKEEKRVAVAKKGAAGVEGKRLRAFLTTDERVPERYRTDNVEQAEITDVEEFAQDLGYSSADTMFDELRRALVGEERQQREAQAGSVKYTLSGDSAGAALTNMVNDATDERMLSEVPHLANPEQMQYEIDASLSNEALVKLRAAEIKLLGKLPPSYREMVRVAKEIARQDVSALTAGELFGRKNVVRKFTEQARRAEKKALLHRGDPTQVGLHQRTALYFRAMANEAVKMREVLEKHQDRLRSRLKYRPGNGKREDTLAQNYGGATVETARLMLDLLGVEVGSGLRSQGDPWTGLNEADPERQSLEQALGDIQSVISTDGALMQQTVEQAMESLEYVEGVLQQGKWARVFELEGRSAQLDEILRRLREQVEAEATPEKSRKSDKSMRGTIKGKIRQWNYTTQRVEALLYAMDGDEQGLLSQLIFVPLRNAEDQVELNLAAVIEKLEPLLRRVRDEVGASAELSRPITTGTDATGAALLPDRTQKTEDPDVLDNGKMDILGMLLHCGNESNLRRLLLGFGWATLRPDGSIDATRWWEQVRQWEEAGVITAADWEFCQGVWDIYEEELLPMTQEAHYSMLGRRMELVDKGMPVLKQRAMADGTVVDVRGGYVPAGRDADLRSPKGERNAQDTLLGFQRSIATINKGHTKNRVDEPDPDPLDINPINQIMHFRQSIIFAQMGPAHKKVATLLRQRDVEALLERMSPGIYKNILDPFMETAATLSSTLVSARGADMLDGIDFVDKLRSNYGTAAMFANVVNSMQGVTGVMLASMSGQVKMRYLMEGMSGGHTKADIYKLSAFMATRHKLGVSAFEMQNRVLNLVESGKFQSLKEAQRWLSKNTYWMQEIIQHPVDLIVWRGAYAQALDEGKGDSQAVNAADGAVRRTQADTAVTSMSKVEKGGRFAKMWTQFLSWFLSLGSMRASAMRRASLTKRQDEGTRAMWVLRVVMSKEAMAGFFTLFMGELIATAFRAEEDEEKDALDTWLIDPLLMTALALPRALGPVGAFGGTVAAQAIPLVVPSLSRDLTYQQRMPAPAAIAIIDQLGRTAANLIKDGADRSDVLNSLELAAKMVGIPLHVLTQRLRRGFDIFDEEKIEPAGMSAFTGRR